MMEEEKGIFERACSRQEVNKFIHDKLQPDEEFHRLFNGAIDFLYQELQRDLQDTHYVIHNLIKVSLEIAPPPPALLTRINSKRTEGKLLLLQRSPLIYNLHQDSERSLGTRQYWMSLKRAWHTKTIRQLKNFCLSIILEQCNIRNIRKWVKFEMQDGDKEMLTSIPNR